MSIVTSRATLNRDTSLAGNGYFLDEDNLGSDSAVQVPSQQSVKAYVDTQISTNGTGSVTVHSDVTSAGSGAIITAAERTDLSNATLNTDTTLAGNNYFLDEDNMASNDATKVPSQQSVKAYADTKVAAVPSTDNAVARYNGVNGALQNSGVHVTDTNRLGVNNISDPAQSFETSAELRISNPSSRSTNYTDIDYRTYDYFASTNALLDLNSHPADGTSDAKVRLFRNTNTTGVVSLEIFRGNNSTNTNHSLRGNGDSFLAQFIGDVGIGTGSPNAKLDVRGSMIINEDAADNDVRIEGTTDANLFRTDAGNDRVGIGTATPSEKLDVVGNVTISGSISKGSGTFDIPHPVRDGYRLRHSFVEGARADNIYRGKALAPCSIKLDNEIGMTEGTFQALNKDVQVFISNNESWIKVRGQYGYGCLMIETEDGSPVEVDWLVIGTRQDQTILESRIVDKNGDLVLEYKKPEVSNDE